MRLHFCPAVEHTHPKRKFWFARANTHTHRACAWHVDMFWFHAHCDGHQLAPRLLDVA